MEKENAGLMRAGAVAKKNIAPATYRASNLSAILPALDIDSHEYAAAKLVRRFRLQIETARVISRLAGIGGAS